MVMAQLLTQPTEEDPRAFVDAIAHPVRRADAVVLLDLMGRATREPAVMWGPTMIGFGSYHYRYASGHEGDALAVGFSPRASAQSLYGLLAAPGAEALLPRLGRHRRGAGCLYVTSLAGIDLDVLEELVLRGHAFLVTGDSASSDQSPAASMGSTAGTVGPATTPRIRTPLITGPRGSRRHAVPAVEEQ